MKRENTLRMPSLLASICSTREKLAAFVLAGGIADHRRAAAHQRDRLAAGLLQPMQHHDLQQRADVQRRRGAIEADIGDQLAAQRLFVEAGEVRALVNVAALDQYAQEIGSGLKRVGHLKAPRPELGADV